MKYLGQLAKILPGAAAFVLILGLTSFVYPGHDQFALLNRQTQPVFLLQKNFMLFSEFKEDSSRKSNAVTSKKAKKKDPKSAMIRSVLFPGWGQFYNQKYWKAALVFGVEFGLVANAIRLNQKVVKSHRDDERTFWQDQRNLNFWWLLAVKLLSMLDVYVDAQLADFDESPSLVIRPAAMPPVQGQPNTISFGLKLKIRFKSSH